MNASGVNAGRRPPEHGPAVATRLGTSTFRMNVVPLPGLIGRETVDVDLGAVAETEPEPGLTGC